MILTWHIGDKINGRWEIRRMLKGGMGSVLVVYDHQLKTVLAAKTFQDEVFAQHARLADYFAREAHIWIHLDAHPNIARAHFIHKIEGKLYLFLEYVSGGSLRDWIGTPRLLEDLPQVLRFALQLCDGMSHVQSKGISAHRDLKPTNCLITEEGTLKVTDFGLAKVLAKAAIGDQEAGFAAVSGLSTDGGTWEYMAPERFRKPKSAGGRADIYSFGIVLYEMLTGQVPFAGQTREEYAQTHQKYALPSIMAFKHQPAPLRALVKTCLAKDPAERYESFAQVRDALAEIYMAQTQRPDPAPLAGNELDVADWADKGVSLAALGRHLEALPCFDCALRADPRYLPASTGKGVSLAALGRHLEALSCFDHALKVDRYYAPAWTGKGTSRAALGQHPEALVCFDYALEADRHYAPAWTGKGVSQAALGRYPEALKLHERAVNLNPWSAAARVNRGMVLAQMGQAEKALWHYLQAIDIDRGYTPAWYHRGAALVALGRYQQALECCDQALVLDGDCVPAWYNRGIALAGLRQVSPALQCYDRALELDGRCVPAWYHKGLAFVALNQHAEALACYDRALEFDSNYVPAWYHKGQAFEALKQHRKALACYNRTLSADLKYAPAWHSKGRILSETLRNHGAARMCFEKAERLGYVPADQERNGWRQDRRR